jgi:hypothetical protein
MNICKITPKFGDRLLLNNVPTSGPFIHLYSPESCITNFLDGIVVVCSCFAPYFDKGHKEASGTYNSVAFKDIQFVKTDLALFWRFKNGEVKAHNGENYTLEVNYFECQFSDLR